MDKAGLIKVANDVARECLRRVDLRDAVVEAARAYAKYKPYDDEDLKELGRALSASIEALERAEEETND